MRAAGLEQTRAVRDAMSGGVVADMLALLVLATVVLSILRAIPVLWDGRHYVSNVPAERKASD